MNKELSVRNVDRPLTVVEGGREAQRAAGTVQRFRLPALESLRVFEAAARHASFTRAAEELCVTQAAVSHRMNALESDLGISLFRRLTRSLELTPEGERLAAGVREGLRHIQRSVGELGSHAETGPLTVSMLPSFASRWLIPRLPRFQRIHPEIQVRVLAEDQAADLRSDQGPDMAIRFGRGRYPGLSVTPMMPDKVIPVCSPYLFSRHGWIDGIDGLLSMPLLHDSATESDESGSDWKSWLSHFGGRADDPRLERGPRFSQAHLAIEAALLGQGVVLARTSLIGSDLTSGRLISPLPQSAPTAFSYFLVCKPEAAESRKVARFREWIVAEAANAVASLG